MRLFVALDLPGAVRDALAALEPDPDVWRRVNPASLHVTLAFLGSREPSDVDLIRPLIVASPAPELALGEILLLPPRRARVLTVELEDRTGALAELQARISAGLEAAGVYTPEKRRFRPHVTIARVRPRVAPPRTAALEVERLEFRGEAVTLYESRLHPSGARYEPIASARLS
ncbi:MAG TPA: RNA 2',3'-cyclic phosphodiesterase [Solirubrobacter sp.]|jgi:2'-5' RNA ligase|nr:RNA 2',3'-cyclic phosphodiesterase [Solirubrobacter sp.]